MKTLIHLIAILFITSPALIAQQKSDYATVQRFQSLTQSISKNIDQAKTVQECAEATTSIDALEKEYKTCEKSTIFLVVLCRQMTAISARQNPNTIL